MIPVFQTRTTTEDIGNCFEACLASIVELPLSQIPDRRSYLDPVAWARTVEEAHARGGLEAVGDLEMPGWEEWEAELRAWLALRGLGLLELEIPTRGSTRAVVLRTLEEIPGYWIGVYENRDEQIAHAVVRRGAAVVHNPHRGVVADEGLGALGAAWVLVACDPPKTARTLGVECLPDVVGELARASACDELEARRRLAVVHALERRA